MTETIRYTADVLLIERGRRPHKGQLTLPGGHVNAGETSRAAAARRPLKVTVVDRPGAGLDGCKHHAARMLASLPGARAYALPEAPADAAARTFKTAAGMTPYAWRAEG